MSKMIQIRNVPDDLHRRLKARAAERGMTLSDYLLTEVEEIADKPTLREWVDMVSKRDKVSFDSGSIVETIHQEREERDRRF